MGALSVIITSGAQGFEDFANSILHESIAKVLNRDLEGCKFGGEDSARGAALEGHLQRMDTLLAPFIKDTDNVIESPDHHQAGPCKDTLFLDIVVIESKHKVGNA